MVDIAKILINLSSPIVVLKYTLPCLFENIIIFYSTNV